MALIDCPQCFTRVMLRADGSCPRCNQAVSGLPESPYCSVPIRERTKLPAVCHVCGVSTTRVVLASVPLVPVGRLGAPFQLPATDGKWFETGSVLKTLFWVLLRGRSSMITGDRPPERMMIRLPECQACEPLGRGATSVDGQRREAVVVVHKAFREALTKARL
jgi:hypothetical protein